MVSTPPKQHAEMKVGKHKSAKERPASKIAKWRTIGSRHFGILPERLPTREPPILTWQTKNLPLYLTIGFLSVRTFGLSAPKPSRPERPPERRDQQPSESPTVASHHSPWEYRPAIPAE